MPILSMEAVSKRFGPVLANDRVYLSVEKGEVHALLGENGAGKSTLMNILYGLHRPDSGRILLEGREVQIHNPRDAIDLGIGMVHQHFMLVPAHSAIENVILGQKDNPAILNFPEAARRLAEMGERYGMPLDPFEKVGAMSVGQQQRLEILKALYRKVNVLILDEPTAVLTPQEVEGLFKVIRQLRDEGKTIIFISHKLQEVQSISDRCTVLRQGRQVLAGYPMAKVQKLDELAALMVGRDVNLSLQKAPARAGKTVLEVKDLRYRPAGQGTDVLKNISFALHAGEILGICGVDGNGQSELIKCITGLLPADGGSIAMDGEDVSGLSARERLRRGVGHIPEDRIHMGMVGAMNVRENLALVDYESPAFCRHGWLRWKAIDQTARQIVRDYEVKTPDLMEKAANLSGGNQQKMVVGRELHRNPHLLIAVHPSRGLDIGATKYIQGEILKRRDQGTAVLLVSTELDEIMELSDRILVLYEGQVMAILDGSTASREELGLLMTGVGRRPAES